MCLEVCVECGWWCPCIIGINFTVVVAELEVSLSLTSLLSDAGTVGASQREEESLLFVSEVSDITAAGSAKIDEEIFRKGIVKVVKSAKNKYNPDRDAAMKMSKIMNPVEHEDHDDDGSEQADEWDSISVEKTKLDYKDDNFSPMSAAGYSNHRIVKKLRFYQKRIPRYYRLLNLFTYTVALLTLTASALTVFNIPPSSQFWVAIATALLIAFAAVHQYCQRSQKTL